MGLFLYLLFSFSLQSGVLTTVNMIVDQQTGHFPCLKVGSVGGSQILIDRSLTIFHSGASFDTINW